MSDACANPHRFGHIAHGVPDVVEPDNVRRLTEERVRCLRLDQRVGLPLVSLAPQYPLEAPDKLNAGGCAGQWQTGYGGRANPIFFKAVDADVLNEVPDARTQIAFVLRLANVCSNALAPDSQAE